VSTAANGGEDACRASKVNGFDDILTIGAISDQRGTTIDHSVPNGASCVVALISWAYQFTQKQVAKTFYRPAIDLNPIRSDV
jgi:hypothetical protein